jgi:hypothetical protein
VAALPRGTICSVAKSELTRVDRRETA